MFKKLLVPLDGSKMTSTRKGWNAEEYNAEAMMTKKARRRKKTAGKSRAVSRESGLPGGGKGRIDVVGTTGVYPMSASERPKGDAPIRGLASWGQGARGAAGYEDSGGSGLVWREGQLLGGLTAGPSGEPTIDIHAPPPVKVGPLPLLPRLAHPEQRDETDDQC